MNWSHFGLGLLLLMTLSNDSTGNNESFRFIDRAQDVGLWEFTHTLGHSNKRWIADAMGSGVAVADFDNDGDDDIYFVNGRPQLDQPDSSYHNALFRNDGGKFVDVTEEAGVGDTGYGMCALFGDINGDGWLDLFVGNYGANTLYQNQGDGTFIDVTEQAGVGDEGYAAAASFADVDSDGDLDLFVGNYVNFDPEKHGTMRENYHGLHVFAGPLAMPHQDDCLYINDGNGRFTNQAKEAGILASPGRAMGSVFFDLENDGDLDLYVTNDSTYNHVLANKGDGTFKDVSFSSGGAFTENGIEGASMGVVTGDYNNDGYLDLYITSYELQSDVLFQNNSEGFLIDETGPLGLLKPSKWLVTWGSAFCDFDSDGWLDIFTSNGHIYPQVEELSGDRTYVQSGSFYRNTGKRFEDISQESLQNVEPFAGRGAALCDYDNDGDMDIIINCIDSHPVLLENQSEQGNWLQVKFNTHHSRHYGARLVLQAGEDRWTRMVDSGSGYLSQHTDGVHFGLGEVTQLDRLKIYYPDGSKQTLPSPPINQRIRVENEAKSGPHFQ